MRQMFEKLKPEQKSKLIKILLVVGVILLAVGLYMTRQSGTEQPQQTAESEYKNIEVNKHILERSAYEEAHRQNQVLMRQVEKLEKELQAIKEERERRQREEKEELGQTERTEVTENRPVVTREGSQQPQIPPPPPPPQWAEGANLKTEEVKPQEIGGIQVVSAPAATQGKEEKKTSEVITVYLPPSFMEGTLLTGLDAPIMGWGKENPVPALIRIKTPAILPNYVRANLKGCFVISSGIGSLATERVNLQLVTLSCIDKKGNAVIDEKVKGFVVDGDGKIGLRGKVVAKFGSTLARSSLAGFFGGIGEGASMSATTQLQTTAGTVQTTIPPENVVKYALGKGLAQGAGKLQEFYLKLAEESIPVIEVGATRTVTVVIQEGVDLKIKEKCLLRINNECVQTDGSGGEDGEDF